MGDNPMENPVFKKLWKLRQDYQSTLGSTETEGHNNERIILFPGLRDMAEYSRGDCPTRMIGSAFSGVMFGTAAGLFHSMYLVPEQIESYSKVEAAELTKLNSSAAIFTRPMFWCTMVTVTYTGASCLAEYVRDAGRTTPWYNAAIGGAAGGLVIGAAVKRFDVAAAAAFASSIVAFGAKLDETFRNEARNHSHAIFEDKYEKTVTEKTLKEKYPEYKDM